MGLISKSFLGEIGGIIAILGVVVLAITSGDTALRSLRLMIADYFHIDQVSKTKRILLALAIFVPVAVILVYSKLDPNGFNILWRYFSFANEACAVFAFALISVYLFGLRKPGIMTLIPGSFYMFVCSSYLLNAKIGFGLEWGVAYAVAGVLAVAYAGLVVRAGLVRRKRLENGGMAEAKAMETPDDSADKAIEQSVA